MSIDPFLGEGPTALGSVSAADSGVSVLRASGIFEDLQPTMTLGKGDVVLSGNSAIAEIVFGDGTVLRLDENSRVIIDAAVDGATGAPAGLRLTVQNGAASVLHPGASDTTAAAPVIKTPAATVVMETGQLAVAHELGAGTFVAMLPDANGIVGRATVQNHEGSVDLAEAYLVVESTAADEPLLSESFASCEQMLAGLSQLAAIVPNHCRASGDTAKDRLVNSGIGEDLSVAELAGLEPAAGIETVPQSVPGETIVVTELSSVYDLKPVGPGYPDAGRFTPFDDTAFEYEEGHPDEIVLLEIGNSGAVATPEVLDQWDPGRVWDIIGTAAEAGVARDTVVLGTGQVIRPTADDALDAMAIVTAGSTSVNALESAFSLPLGTLDALGDGDGFAGGSATRAQSGIGVLAGQSIAFDVFFDPAGSTADTDIDQAMMTITQGSDAVVVPLFDTQDVIDLRGAAYSSLSGTGWQTVVFTPDTTGIYQFGFMALNDDSTELSSRLMIDNIRVAADPTPSDYQVLSTRDVPLGGTIEVLAPAPDIADAVFATGQNDPLIIGLADGAGIDAVLAVTDPDPYDPMSIFADDTGAVGDASPLDNNTRIAYDPGSGFDQLAEGETATDTFTYIVDGGNGVQRSATITVQVTGANDAPMATDDAGPGFAVGEDGVLTTASVLANDVDPDTSDVLTVIAVEGSTVSGFLTNNGNGTFDYDPGERFNGLGDGATATETFTYTVSDRTDGSGEIDNATVTLTIIGANDVPLAVADSITVNAHQVVTLASLLANDSDIDDSDVIAVASVDGASALGEVKLNASIVSYDPAGAFDTLALGESAADMFSYRIVDTAGAISEAAFVSVIVLGVNDAPTAFDVSIVAAENTLAAIALSGDDIDPDDDATTLSFEVTQTPTLGLVVAQADGTFLFDPGSDFDDLGVGATESVSFEFVAIDQFGLASAPATATIVVSGENDAPIAVDDVAVTTEDATVTISLLANDRDIDLGDTLSVIGIDTAGATGVVTLSGDGAVIYDPAGRFQSLAPFELATETFTYTVSDGIETATATATVTISGLNDAPVPTADAFAGSENDIIARDAASGLLANDSDPEGQELTAIVFSGLSTRGADVVVNADGSFSYDPSGSAAIQLLANSETIVDTFTYQVRDALFEFAPEETTVEITLTGVNDAPVANDDILLIDGDDPLLVVAPVEVFLVNDIDPEGTPLEFFLLSPISARGASLAYDSVTGDFTYDMRTRTDLADFPDGSLPDDSFNYIVFDGDGGSAIGTVNVFSDFGNVPPMAADDTAVTDQDSAVRITVLSNDTDADLSRLDRFRLLNLETNATLGEVRINPGFNTAEDSLTYDPNGAFDDLAPGETATDIFSYIIDDLFGATSTGTVTITVTGIDSPQVTSQEILESFADGNLDAVPWQIDLQLDSEFAREDVAQIIETFSDPFAEDGADDFAATHGETFVAITAVGTTALLTSPPLSAVERFLSNPVTPLAESMVRIPESADIAISPNTAGAIARDLVVSADDLVDGAITLSFDWNFISAENDILSGGANDIAVFSIASPDDAAVVTIAESAILGSGASGWRRSVFSLSEVFDIDPGGTLDLRVGFAVINDLSSNRPSQLLVDNIRLNQVPDNSFEELTAFDELGSRETNPNLVTFRQNPAANGDFGLADAATDEETRLLLDPATLLANDQASAGVSAVSFVGVEAGDALGAVSVDDAGITYDPGGALDFLAEGETTTERFLYSITDANGGLASAEVEVTVAGINDAPEAAADFATVGEDGPVVVIDVLANDLDADSDDDAASLSIASATAASGASVTFSAAPGASLTYDPGGIFDFLSAGETVEDIITYTVVDSHGAVSAPSTVRVTVMGVNDAPVANADFIQVSEDTARVVSVLANDTDPDRADTSATLRIVDASSALGATLTVTSEPGGALGYDARGVAAFQALRDGETLVDTVTYTVADAAGDEAAGILTVEIQGADDAPNAVDDAFTAQADTVLSVTAAAGLLANDSDPEGDSLTVAAVSTLSAAGAAVVINGDGSFSYNPMGVLAFQQLAAAEMSVDSFTYTVVDESGLLSVADVALTVVGINDAPVVASDVASTREDETVLIDVLANDSDPDLGDVLTVSAINGVAVDGGDTVSLASGALVNLTTDGRVLYDPNGAFDGLGGGETGFDDFSYTVADSEGAEASGSVSLEIEGRSGLEVIVESFEDFDSGIPFSERAGSVRTVTGYQETDGEGTFYSPTDGDDMALISSFGANYFFTIAPFLGIPFEDFLRDPVDGSRLTTGQVFRVEFDGLLPGDEISFDWMFDARDFTDDPPDGFEDNDAAVLFVSNGTPESFYTLSDVRTVGDQGASGWLTTRIRADGDSDLTLAFLALGDRGASDDEVSTLLVDNVRINRDFSDGYQVVDSQSGGIVETLSAIPAS